MRSWHHFTRNNVSGMLRLITTMTREPPGLSTRAISERPEGLEKAFQHVGAYDRLESLILEGQILYDAQVRPGLYARTVQVKARSEKHARADVHSLDPDGSDYLPGQRQAESPRADAAIQNAPAFPQRVQGTVGPQTIEEILASPRVTEHCEPVVPALRLFVVRGGELCFGRPAALRGDPPGAERHFHRAIPPLLRSPRSVTNLQSLPDGRI